MADRSTSDLPSPFVVQWTAALAPALPGKRRVLDVAMGRGRHARLLSDLDVAVYGIDRDFEAVRSVVHEAAGRGRIVRGWCADLTAFPLPRAAFEMVVCTRYLQRDLMGAIGDAVAPGGIVIYETFTIHQRERGIGPRSPDHLLQPGELPDQFKAFEILFSEEITSPEAVARLVARKPR
jgi:SAM-dependent methyltransferase